MCVCACVCVCNINLTHGRHACMRAACKYPCSRVSDTCGKTHTKHITNTHTANNVVLFTRECFSFVLGIQVSNMCCVFFFSWQLLHAPAILQFGPPATAPYDPGVCQLYRLNLNPKVSVNTIAECLCLSKSIAIVSPCHCPLPCSRSISSFISRCLAPSVHFHFFFTDKTRNKVPFLFF